jgi:hypothetical protein
LNVSRGSFDRDLNFFYNFVWKSDFGIGELELELFIYKVLISLEFGQVINLVFVAELGNMLIYGGNIVLFLFCLIKWIDVSLFYLLRLEWQFESYYFITLVLFLYFTGLLILPFLNVFCYFWRGLLFHLFFFKLVRDYLNIVRIVPVILVPKRNYVTLF